MNVPSVRAWRCLLVIYVLVLTAGTHWPRLQLGSAAGTPDPDKLAHFVAFGGLAFLLWRTEWVSSPLRWLALMLAWTMLDEASQALPILERSTDWRDILAGQMGVMAVAGWRGALALRPKRPDGPGAESRPLARRMRVLLRGPRLRSAAAIRNRKTSRKNEHVRHHGSANGLDSTLGRSRRRDRRQSDLQTLHGG
jgi:hypothetical protein